MKTSKAWLTPLILSGALVSASAAIANPPSESTLREHYDRAHERTSEAWQDSKKAVREGVLAGRLEMAFLLNQHLNPFDISTEVEGDRAILSGKVSTDIERDLAVNIARGIDGIRSVDNRIEVDEKAKKKSDSEGRGFAQYVSDATTTASIKTELLANGNINGMAITVETRNNEVTLSGEVETPEEKSLAEAIAKKRDGVARVVNKIDVNS